jgi:signal transduction histidine kinase
VEPVATREGPRAWLRATGTAGDAAVPRWIGAIATAALLLVVAGALGQSFSTPRLVDALIVVGLSVAGLWRLPLRRAVGGFVAMLAAVGLVGNNSASLALLAVSLLAFEAGYLNRGWRSAPVIAVPAVALIGHAIADFVNHVPTGWYLSAFGLFVVWGGGILTRREQSDVEALKQAHAELAARAVAEERHRIARDVHDLVAHSLSVTMLHLTAARLSLRRDPDQARAALIEAERVGRESMLEIRRTVGMLPRSDAAVGTPVPSASAISDLVDDLRRAGMPVTSVVDGDPERVPAPAGLSLYRIVQEALANAARHAPGQPACVHLRIGARTVDARIDNPLPGGRPPDDGGGGHGLAGMAERAQLAGGWLHAGPADGRWSVTVSMPLEPA